MTSPSSLARARVLYISYDGLMEPLGQSQVLQYLKLLAALHEVTLLSFEKATDLADTSRRASVASEAREAGFQWQPRRYHLRPTALATLYDIASGTIAAYRLVRRQGIGIVHARSYVAGAICLLLKRLVPVRFVFDMRGFWADERMEGGQFSATSPMYRALKRLERQLFRDADAVVSLTAVGVPVIAGLAGHGAAPPVTVIPTCTNQTLFRPGARTSAPGGFTLGYVGSVGTRYLFDSVLEFFRLLLARRPDARLRIINRAQHAYITERVRAAGIPEDRVQVSAASFGEVPAHIAGMDAGIMFYRPSFSTLGTAPTRLGEFLSCGVPCVGNDGVGDVREVIESGGVGVVVRDFDSAAMARAVDDLLAVVADERTRARCLDVARSRFSLAEGVRAYDRIYRSLLPTPAGQ